MSRRKWVTIVGLALGLPYLALGTLVVLRRSQWSDPDLAARDFLDALRKRDAVGIYLYADMLGPRLSGMMEKSDLAEDEKKYLWAKDFGRWREEFEKGSRSMDSLRQERALISPQTRISAMHPDNFRAEVRSGEDLNLVTYHDVPGECYHRYFKLEFPSIEQAPPVDLLQNIQTAGRRHIKSVVIRVEINRRPEVGPIESLLLKWLWLDKIAWLYPTGLFGAQDNPEARMLARLGAFFDNGRQLQGVANDQHAHLVSGFV